MENINNGRATINSRGSELEIIIPAKKLWFAIIFGSVWLMGLE